MRGNVNCEAAGVSMYGYKWQQAATRYVKDNPMCASCGDVAVLHSGTSKLGALKRPPVDHVCPHHGDHDLFWDEANWQTLCESCHDSKTRAEDGIKRLTWEPRPDRYVVCGKPATGKTTWVQRHAPPGSLVWDADEVANQHGMMSYPRTDRQFVRLQEMRRAFVSNVADVAEAVYVVVASTRTAYAIAKRLEAAIVVMWAREDVRQRRLRERWVKTG